jgi:hypothetical protein
MRKLTIFVLVLACAAVSAQETPPAPAQTIAGPAQCSATIVPGDDWLAKITSAKDCVEVKPGTYSFSPLKLSMGKVDIRLDDGVIITDKPGYAKYDQLLAVKGQNISIAGSGGPNAALLTMPNSFAKNVVNPDRSSNQYNNCIWTVDARNVIIKGLRFSKCGGDSLYVANTKHYLAQGNVSDNPIRNGCSATDFLTDVVFDGNTFQNARDTKAGIHAGCDAEPNPDKSGQRGNPKPGEFVSGLVFRNNKFLNNQGQGLCICLYFMNSSVPLDITVENNQSDGNRVAYDRSNWPSPMNGAVRGGGNTANGQPVNFPN